MKEMPEHSEKQSTRRETLKRFGKFAVPTLVTFQMTTLKVRASGTLDLPKGKPFVGQ